MNIQTTLLYCFVAVLLSRYCCPLFGMFNQLNLPYMLSWILGAVLGDWRTGLIVGALVTTLNMAPVVIGAVHTMSLWDAAVLMVALVVGEGMDMEIAFAIAAPMAVLGNALVNLQAVILYDGIADNLALRAVRKGDLKALVRAQSVIRYLLSFVWLFVWYFILVYFGTRAADTLVNAMPGWLVSGFAAGGKLLPAVGFGLFLAAMGKKKFIPFFIIGAYLALYFGLSTVAIAVMAGAVGFIYIGLDKNEETMMEEVN